MATKRKPGASRRSDTAAARNASRPATRIGDGGELHQHGDETLTTAHGVPVADNQNSLRAGTTGPTLLEDFVLREKIFHFDHERIPERIVHARGSAAHGWFECTHSIPELTRASLFQEAGTRVPVFARFSTVAGGAGSADTPRDVRGFAVKFYTETGNWDLVGNNIPVFFIQDAIKFPDLVHAVKMEADRGYPQAASAHDTFWDFASLMPESTHMLMWVMSDRTLPRSLRMMDGFGVHTFVLEAADGSTRFAKFHWRPALGVQSTLWDEAVRIAGADPDFHRRDLFEAIAAGDHPEWTLFVQVFDDEFADAQPYDVLDATKLVPEEDVPLQEVGRMVLDRNPDNFFAETEQVAFLPTNLVPGISFSADPLLQGRLFSYLDTQKSRLGTTNFHQLPINAAKCPVTTFLRDGMMQTGVPQGRASYEPNSLAEVGEPGGPRADTIGGHHHAPHPTTAAPVRARSERFGDHYSQARQFWRSQTAVEQAHIASAFVFELSKVGLAHVRERMLTNLGVVDPELAARVSGGLGLGDPPAPTEPFRAPYDAEPIPSLSMLRRPEPPANGRKVGILVANGSSATALGALRRGVAAAGATPMVIAPTAHVSIGGERVAVDGQLAGTPSVLLDAVALVLTKDAVAELASDAAAVQFVADAFAHLKAILADDAAAPLLDAAGVVPDEWVGAFGPDVLAALAARRRWEREPSVRRLA